MKKYIIYNMVSTTPVIYSFCKSSFINFQNYISYNIFTVLCDMLKKMFSRFLKLCLFLSTGNYFRI